MFTYQNLAVKLIVTWVIVLTNLCWVFPAGATTEQLQINSDHGYRVTTAFSYDETDSSGAIAEQGKGGTNKVNSLTVSFYDPAGVMVASYDNIVDGMVQGNYFEFHYDPINHKVLGEIDLGGESEGEIYLKGNINQELSLIKIESSGEESTLDSGNWSITSN